MGDVYRARDSKLGRDVALKVLPEGFASDPDRLSRFQREATLLASLNHPHIATIHGLEGEGAERVLVLELVEGEDLALRIAAGPVPVKEALSIARQVADAIESAHDQGIVHRDLKPANIVVTPAGTVKVLDFGLAKAIESDTSNSNLSHSPTLLANSPTMAGVILGTAAYMSPEQARGKRVDRRADIFAFGCVLFEMLTGRQSFSGETVSDTLAAVLRAEPDWSLLPADTPRAVVKLLKRCLEKDPRQRLRDIGEARIVIEAVERGGVEDEPAASASASEKSKRRNAIPWAIAAVAIVIAFATHPRQEAPPPISNVQLSMLLPPNASLSLRGQHPAPPAISPDGKRVVFGIASQGGATLWVRSLDEPEAVELPGTDNAGYPFWSPDSRQIGFFASGKLKRVDASGGPVSTLCDASLGKGGTWGNDGNIYFAPNYASGIMRISADGGTRVEVVRPDSAKGEVSNRFPRLLPDGKHFMYVSRTIAVRSGETSDTKIKLKIASVDGKLNRELMLVESNAAYSNGYLLFLRNRFLVAQRFNPESFELSGEPIPIASDVRNIAGASWGIFDVASTGTLLYQQGDAVEGNQLTWVDMKGNVISQLGGPAQHQDPIVISPDQREVAITIFDNRIGTPDIWIYDIARNLKTRFTTDPAADAAPLWSPDGKKIMFSSARSGHLNLYVKSVGGSATEEPFLVGKEDAFATAWTPDGKLVIVAELVQGGGWELRACPLTGADPVKLMSISTGFTTDISPSGRWLAFDTADSGVRNTFVVPLFSRGRRWQISADGGFAPRWVGSHIYYFNEQRMMRTEVAAHDSTLTIGSEEILFPVNDLLGVDVTRKEDRLLLLQSLDAANRYPLSVVLDGKSTLPATAR